MLSLDDEEELSKNARGLVVLDLFEELAWLVLDRLRSETSQSFERVDEDNALVGPESDDEEDDSKNALLILVVVVVVVGLFEEVPRLAVYCLGFDVPVLFKRVCVGAESDEDDDSKNALAVLVVVVVVVARLVVYCLGFDVFPIFERVCVGATSDEDEEDEELSITLDFPIELRKDIKPPYYFLLKKPLFHVHIFIYFIYIVNIEVSLKYFTTHSCRNFIFSPAKNVNFFFNNSR